MPKTKKVKKRSATVGGTATGGSSLSSALVTPPRKKSRRRVKDRYEYSPTGRAKCRKCEKTIDEGSIRVGKAVHDPRYGYSYHYYHDDCFPEDEKSELLLAAGSPEDELAGKGAKAKELKEMKRVLKERKLLGDNLRSLRMEFARRLGKKEAYKIYKNETLDDIVVRLPRNKTELLAVYGFGEKRFRNFGESILQVVHHYVRSSGTKHQSTMDGFLKKNNNNRDDGGGGSGGGGDKDDEGQEVVVLASLSVEEIVAKRFAEAEKDGHVISLD